VKNWTLYQKPIYRLIYHTFFCFHCQLIRSLSFSKGNRLFIDIGSLHLINFLVLSHISLTFLKAQQQFSPFRSTQFRYDWLLFLSSDLLSDFAFEWIYNLKFIYEQLAVYLGIGFITILSLTTTLIAIFCCLLTLYHWLKLIEF